MLSTRLSLATPACNAGAVSIGASPKPALDGEPEFAAGAGGAVDADDAAHQRDQLLRDCQASPEPPYFLDTEMSAWTNALNRFLTTCAGDADAAVDHLNTEFDRVGGQRSMRGDDPYRTQLVNLIALPAKLSNI